LQSRKFYECRICYFCVLGILPFVLHDNRRGGVRPPVALVLSFAMRRDVENKEVPQSPQKKEEVMHVF